MMKLVECIPNFSVSRERDEAAFNALVDTAKAVPGCTVLDVQSDGTHNRCVFTLVGPRRASARQPSGWPSGPWRSST